MAERPESKEIVQQYPFDAVVLLCGGVKQRETGRWDLNFESKLKVAAAAEIYKQGLTSVIISSGGALWEAPPIGKLMADVLSSKFKVPREVIVEENTSTDTSVQVENTLGIIRERGFKHIAVLADSEHVKRAAKLFQNYGFEVSPLSAENYLLQRSSHYGKIVERLHNSKYWKYWRIRETLLRALLLVDKKQVFFRQATDFIRTKTELRLPGTK